MTLKQLFEELEGLALQIPDIRSCVRNDVTRLNERREVEYGVFAITQNSHSYQNGAMTYSVNLFYIDRLVNSEDNELEIQSHGIEILKTILKAAKNGGMTLVGDGSFTCLTQRFQDLCAGAWATVTFTFMESECAEF